MNEANVYIYGEIYPDNSDYASEWGVVSLKDVVKQVKNANNPDKIILHINSRGGDVIEGFAIHDYIRSLNIPTESVIEGLCASIATIIMLAADTRRMFQNSEFLIHNPWGFAAGDADDMEDYAETLRKFEDRIVDLYLARTKASKEQLKNLMDEEKLLSSDVALELGFVNEVIETVKAVALFSNKNHNKMELNILNNLTSTLNKIHDAITGGKNTLKLQTADGLIAEFDTEKSDIGVGNTITVDGKRPADGDIFLSDKRIVTVKDGKVESIKTPEPNDSAEVVEILNSMNTAIGEFGSTMTVFNNFMASQNTRNEQVNSALLAIAAKVEEIGEAIASGYTPPSDRKIETDLKQETPVEAAIRIEKEEREKKATK